MILCLFILTLFSAGVLSAKLPCSIEDTTCLTEAAQEAYVKVMAENKALGVESSDPMHTDLIDGDLSILKFKLTDTITKGYKSCKVGNVKIAKDISQVHIRLSCPDLDLRGKYDISGRLIVLPVEGNGDYHINAKRYRVDFSADVKLNKDDNGKTYASIKNFKIDAEPLGGIVFDFRNLFNGRKDLADTVLQFANENWKEVGSFVQPPVFNTNVKKIVKSINKYLKTIPVEYFLQQS